MNFLQVSRPFFCLYFLTLAFVLAHGQPVLNANPKCKAIGCKQGSRSYWGTPTGFCYQCDNPVPATQAARSIATEAFQNKVTPITLFQISGEVLYRELDEESGSVIFSYARGLRYLPSKPMNDWCKRYKNDDGSEFISLHFVLVYAIRFMPQPFKKKEPEDIVSVEIDPSIGPERSLEVKWQPNHPMMLQHRQMLQDPKNKKKKESRPNVVETQYGYIEWTKRVNVDPFQAARDAVAAATDLVHQDNEATQLFVVQPLKVTNPLTEQERAEWERHMARSVALHCVCIYGGSRPAIRGKATRAEFRILEKEIRTLLRKKYEANDATLSMVYSQVIGRLVSGTKKALESRITNAEGLQEQERTQVFRAVSEKCSKQAQAWVESFSPKTNTTSSEQPGKANLNPADARKLEINKILGLSGPAQQPTQQAPVLQPVPKYGKLPEGF